MVWNDDESHTHRPHTTEPHHVRGSRLVKKIRELEDTTDTDTWEAQGGTRRQCLDMRLELHLALGRTVGDADVMTCRDLSDPVFDDVEGGHQLYLELQHLAEC